MTLLLFIATLIIAYLIYRNYQLEKRWRCFRYCWQSMSDLAGERLRDGDETDAQWRDAVREQAAFMRRFGASPLSRAELMIYEAALLERNLPILTEHKPL
jgi:hypothetical protein